MYGNYLHSLNSEKYLYALSSFLCLNRCIVICFDANVKYWIQKLPDWNTAFLDVIPVERVDASWSVVCMKDVEDCTVELGFVFVMTGTFTETGRIIYNGSLL